MLLFIDYMLGVILNPSKVDLRAVIQLLTSELCQPVEIHHRIESAYGDKCASQTTVKNWAQMFLEWYGLASDHLPPGEALFIVTEEAIGKINAAV